jgi:hypothetical protein
VEGVHEMYSNVNGFSHSSFEISKCQVMCDIVIKGFYVIVHSPLVYDVRESLYKAYFCFFK